MSHSGANGEEIKEEEETETETLDIEEEECSICMENKINSVL